MRGEVLAVVTPFAPRFGMEIGMTADAHAIWATDRDESLLFKVRPAH